MTAGDGPVDAIFLAIEKITGVTVGLPRLPRARVTVGKDAQGEVNVEVEHNGQRLPRPRRLDRQRRSQRPGVPQRHQPRRRSASGPATEPHATAEHAIRLR